MAATLKGQAIALGRDAGENAAAWWAQYSGGGRDTRSNEAVAEWARETLRGIYNCDPLVMDTLPRPNLSGEWAGDPTPATLAGELGIDHDDERLDSLCDAWQEAADRACMDAIYRHLRRCAKS